MAKSEKARMMTEPLNDITPAQTLLHVLSPFRRPETLLPDGSSYRHGEPSGIPTNEEAKSALLNFQADIRELDRKHNGSKMLTDDQLAEQVFKKNVSFENFAQFLPYGRYQLRLARQEMDILVDDIQRVSGGELTYDGIWSYNDFLTDYLFDLREILVQLQNNVDGWRFFDGGKSSHVDSWQIYLLANNLAWQSTISDPGKRLPHKTAQIASIGVLRQAMELRFERLISVYPIDRNGNPPKLKHGFHQTFIASRPDLFQAQGFDVGKLRHLYDWCSEIVHQAYQPYTWLISFGLRRAGKLLHTQASYNGRWSIFNAVRVTDVEAMQDAFESYFLDYFGHGEWKFYREKPEALVDGWTDDMRKPSDEFVAVTNPRQGRVV
ncbi:hypothetical protein [Agrobacterium tumefaciens]|uniref:hypothetical protein n=1 Tax=Agrobacterium tumefaciens TaxID=358 RepID=UPI003BA0AD2B